MTDPNGSAETATEQAAPENGQATQAQDTDSAQSDSAQSGSEGDSGAKKGRGRPKSTAKKTRSVELTLTVTGTAEGEWQADLTHQGKRVVQGLSVPASSVTKAASELHPDISEAIEEVVSAAREQHQAKLAELEAEVERVRKQLADLEG